MKVGQPLALAGNAALFDAGRYDIPGSGDTNGPRDAYASMAPTAAPRGKVDPMEEFKVSGAALMEKLKELIHEGNVRRIILKNPEGRTLFDMPLNAGIAGMALLDPGSAERLRRELVSGATRGDLKPFSFSTRQALLERFSVAAFGARMDRAYQDVLNQIE